jgi:O-methyltransferase involved in polyketide biosynthesis
LISQFIAAARAKDGGKEQIVSLGAGMDTNFFNLKSGVFGDGVPRGGYFEVDMPSVIEKKRAIIRRNSTLEPLAGLRDEEPSDKVEMPLLT